MSEVDFKELTGEGLNDDDAVDLTAVIDEPEEEAVDDALVPTVDLSVDEEESEEEESDDEQADMDAYLDEHLYGDKM